MSTQSLVNHPQQIPAEQDDAATRKIETFGAPKNTSSTQNSTKQLPNPWNVSGNLSTSQKPEDMSST
jgi:hypothetical protein